MKNKFRRNKSENSMSNASKVICMEEECIGKLFSDKKAGVKKQENNAGEHKKPTTRSSMKFGKDGSCSDEECIGKT
jgi:hypothetical protein